MVWSLQQVEVWPSTEEEEEEKKKSFDVPGFDKVNQTGLNIDVNISPSKIRIFTNKKLSESIFKKLQSPSLPEAEASEMTARQMFTHMGASVLTSHDLKASGFSINMITC